MLRVALALSVTLIVEVPAAPAAVGAPEIMPAVLIVIPGGSPVAVNVYGAVPPLAPPDTLMLAIATPTVDAGMSYAALPAKAKDEVYAAITTVVSAPAL
jgi:hypothetical protein